MPRLPVVSALSISYSGFYRQAVKGLLPQAGGGGAERPVAHVGGESWGPGLARRQVAGLLGRGAF